jgi:hypothetical protein
MNQGFTARLLERTAPGPVLFGPLTPEFWGIVITVFCGSAGLLLVWVIAHRLWRYRQPPSAGFCLDEFSLARYQPMARLLSGEDLQFVASRPGCRRRLLARLKRDRRRIFRMYLYELAGDFRALHGEARRVAARLPAHQDALVARRAAFWKSIALIELRLLFPRTGMADVSRLIESMEALHVDLIRIAA